MKRKKYSNGGGVTTYGSLDNLVANNQGLHSYQLKGGINTGGKNIQQKQRQIKQVLMQTLKNINLVYQNLLIKIIIYQIKIL